MPRLHRQLCLSELCLDSSLKVRSTPLLQRIEFAQRINPRYSLLMVSFRDTFAALIGASATLGGQLLCGLLLPILGSASLR